MILPTKRITEDRSLLGIGSDILPHLGEPKTVSRLWFEFQQRRSRTVSSIVTYDWFVMALDLLFMLGAISMEKGLLRRVTT
jgi:hypothetical protein